MSKQHTLDRNRIAEFKDLYKVSFKKNPLLDYKNFECYISLFVGIIATDVLYLIYTSQDSSASTTIIQNLCLYIGAALMGMLGFIVGGLAIISGTLSGKVVKNIDKAGQFDSIIAILFSFHFVGLVIGVLIVMFFLAYALVSINFEYVKYLYLFLCFSLAYGLSFVIFFSVSLLGTCINMFILNYNYSMVEKNQEINKEVEACFIAARIDALSSLMVQKKLISKEDFISEVKDRIEDDCPEVLKSEVEIMMNKYYGL
ncbi:hypothetical protein SDC9_20872 [bioreactor metagenome]|uniref:Uncharacterized protein n=1 Tax=bioreactor metagenome TaxID=1076179 RepID=A0A644U7X9_9ZZZZ|nr:hypothetical protein [Negativicutes bacterium]